MNELEKMVRKADLFAEEHHEGQKWAGGPYIFHLKSVAELVDRYSDNKMDKVIALLHDFIEDVDAKKFIEYVGAENASEYKDYEILRKVLEKEFNLEVAQSVLLLSRVDEIKVDRKKYEERIERAPYNIQLVKLCDFMHNTSHLENLKKFKSRRRKIVESFEFYIPLAKKVNAEIAEELKRNIMDYFERNPGQRISDYFIRNEKEEVIKGLSEEEKDEFEKELREFFGVKDSR